MKREEKVGEKMISGRLETAFGIFLYVNDRDYDIATMSERLQVQ